MREHDRIARYFAPLSAGEPGSFSLTDDTAVLTPPNGQQIVITTDSAIQGIHVLSDATPRQFVQKLVRRNLSDIAAMGAAPWRYTLNLHTSKGLAHDWFVQFAATLADEQERFGMVLIGGDSTSGGGVIHITMTCLGLLNGAPLRRNGAVVGDAIYISGTLGDAAFALHQLQNGQPVAESLAARYHAPEPRLVLGQKLRGIASAAIDISDGLAGDVQKLCKASDCGASIEQAALPFSAFLRNIPPADAITYALSGGDDYELCFTAAPTQQGAIERLAAELQLPLTRIGQVTQGGEVKVVDAKGNALPVARMGWEHD